MAADWIKLRVDIYRDPAVLKMSDTCRTNRHHIVGLLSDVWGWIDGHTVDGSCPNISIDMLDSYIGMPGFAAAMASVGWLEVHGDGVIFPKWDRHNSMTAKARALENEAKRLRRKNVGQVSDKTSDKVSIKRPTREEKRREEKNKVEPKPKKALQRPTLSEVVEFVKTIHLPDSDGEATFHKWEGNGFTNGGKPIKDWKATIRAWKAAGYMPSQKQQVNGSKAASPGRVFRNPDGTTFISEKNY